MAFLDLNGLSHFLDKLKTIFARNDGSYSSLTAGNAEQLVSTVGVNDKTPYLFRTTGGSADVGDRVKLSEITGGTVAWNQLATTEQRTISVTPDGTYTFSTSPVAISTTANHVYFVAMTVKNYNGGKTLRAYCQINVEYGMPAQDLTGTSKAFAWLCKPSAGGASIHYGLSNLATADKLTSADAWTRDDTQVIDLTSMFGSTIADYLFGLESGTAGAGVAKLKSWGFCTAPYYAYDAGSLLSVKTSAHKEIGFNQWDEEWEVGGLSTETGAPSLSNTAIRSKNFIPCVPSTTYYLKAVNAASYVWFYDAGKNFITFSTNTVNKTFSTPANCYYMKLMMGDSSHTMTSYSGGCCLNLHWDGERDGEYEPYEEHTYALDDVELRGIPKLDASNNLYYDGDSYEASGTVTRKYATRAYEAGDATDGSTMITDGTNTVYKLGTPTTESADPYQETQICNDFGTEEFVDSRTVPMPVGANALYQANLRAKLEMVPDSPDGNGDYIVRQTDGLNEYVLLEKELPTAPAEDGTYSLKYTVADGTATLSWVADE